MSDFRNMGAVTTTTDAHAPEILPGSEDGPKIWSEFPIWGFDSRTTVISSEQAASNSSLLAIAIVIVATGVFAGTLYKIGSGQKVDAVGDFLATGLLVAVIFSGILRISTDQRLVSPSGMYDRANQALLAWMMSFAVLLAIVFAGKLGTVVSRGAIISHFLLGLAVVPVSHMHLPIFLTRFQKRSAFKFHDIILVGARGDTSLMQLVAELRRGGCQTPYVVEFDARCSDHLWAQERKALFCCVTNLARRLRPGEIYVAGAQIPRDRMQNILRSLTLIPRPVLVVPDRYTTHLLRHRLSAIGEEIAVAVQREPLSRFGRAFKRGTDVVLSMIGIVFLAPVFVAIAIAIKCDSKGPILFRQTRNGYQGRSFLILKFRTMTVMEDGAVIVQARKDDRRVTRLGAWLRRTSLDELPQLFNVLRGEMSLIGPRPHARAHDEMYSKLIENYEIRQHVKPGITGWAQVNGLRGETQTVDIMRQRIEFDLWYARNCSILLDMRILARTVLEVFRPVNAY